MEKRVIGIDLGNWNAYVSCVDNLDKITRAGGTERELIPDKYREIGVFGIPNEFCWNGKDEFFGFNAISESLRPQENHLRLLKRNMQKSITLYDEKKTTSKTFKYSDLVTKAFSYVAGIANDALRETYGESGTTNLISITYPASLRSPAAVRYFISLAEAADSGVKDANGKMLKLKVVGALCEPASAGLDRLNQIRDTVTADTVTYGVFDLGGGTFDLSIVSLYPNGKTDADGDTYYFEPVIDGEGLNIGGGDFTKALGEIFREKLIAEANVKGNLPPRIERQIRQGSERAKLELTNQTKTTMSFDMDDDYYDITVTRDEFEARIKPSVDKIIDCTTEFFHKYSNQAPDEIIITGGSSNLPCVLARLNEALPEYSGRIQPHRPSKAASFGASRFYNARLKQLAEDPNYNGQSTSPNKDTPKETVPEPLHRTVSRDISTIIFDNGVKVMDTLIKAGTKIPCTSGIQTYCASKNGQKRMDYSIYEANRTNPTNTAISIDYNLMHSADLVFKEAVSEGTETNCELSIDELGRIILKAWQKGKDNIKIEETFHLNDN